tara:strand:+ start:56451 stop:57281 length:831 start_codon:yes stop_codon:yes gene_type:complete
MTAEKNNNNKIDINATKRLSVQVHLNGLSFLMQDEDSHTGVFFKHITFDSALMPEEVLTEIKKAYETYEELNQSVKEFTLVHQNLLFTLVPKAVFYEDQAANYLNFNAKLLPTDYVAYDTLETLDLINVYVPLTNVNNYFFERYGEFTYKHAASVFIESIIAQERNNNDIKMFVHLYKRQMDVLVTKGKKIQLFNSFYHTTPEDFIYYILFIAEQLSLNPDEFPLHLSGNIKKKDPYFEIAYTYIRNVTVSENKSATLESNTSQEPIENNSLLFQL